MIGPTTIAWLQTQTYTSDSKGGRTYTWTNKVRLYGTMVPASANEQLISGRDAIRFSYRFIFQKQPVKDYTQYIVGKNRLYISGVVYKIVEVIPFRNFYELRLERDA